MPGESLAGVDPNVRARIRWVVLMESQGACSPWDISHLEGANPEHLMQVQRGCVEHTNGAGTEGPVVISHSQQKMVQWESPIEGCLRKSLLFGLKCIIIKIC